MATTIVTKNSSTASAVPTAAQLVQGELAVNVADKRIYTENNAGAIVELGTNPSAEIVANGGIALPDNSKATFGAGNDLQIYSDGTNAIIKEDTGGSLYIGGADIHLMNPAFTEYYISAAQNGAVTLRHDNATKLATTATGIDVTGTATMDGLSLDNAQYISFKNSSNASTRALGINGANTFYVGGIDADIGDILFVDGGATRVSFANGGDISFYEDTGTTAKLFWDASAESLGIGTSSPNYSLTSYKAGANANYLQVVNGSSGPNAANGILYGLDGAGNGVINKQGAGDLITYVANTERMRIDSAGNVGIGTSSPDSYRLNLYGAGNGGRQLKVEGTSNNGLMRFSNSEVKDYSIGINGTSFIVYDDTADTYRMVVDTNGNVGIGTTSPSNYSAVGANRLVVGTNVGSNGITIVGGTTGYASLAFADSVGSGGNDDYAGLIQYSHITNGMNFFTNSTQKMVLDSAGNLLVGTTDANPTNNNTNSAADRGIAFSGGQGWIANTTYNETTAYFNRTGTDGTIIELIKSGTAVGSISVTASATAYNTSSDQRLKENIADADDAGSKIDAIQVRQYDWKSDGSHQDYGMIAQELQAVAPEAVSGDADSEEMMGVDYSKLVPMLIKEIQSLRNRVAQLEA